MIIEIGIFLGGIILLVGGAWALVRGGTQVAAVLGVPTVVVGLTVVAFGTSAPELFVSLVGALRGNAGLVLGNVVGSNIANLGLILAVAAILRPMVVEKRLIRWSGEVPMMLVATAGMMWLVKDGELSRTDSLLLVIGFGLFMTLVLKSGRSMSDTSELSAAAPPGRRLRQALRGIGLVVLGIAGLAGGGQLIVTSALDLALRLGVSETLIGLTLVAVGTSLPELATTVMAAVQKENDLALGNIIGSNLFNTLAVAGPVGLIHPLAAESGLTVQLWSMGGITLVVTLLLVLGRGRFGRTRGIFVLIGYLGIMTFWVTGN